VSVSISRELNRAASLLSDQITPLETYEFSSTDLLVSKTFYNYYDNSIDFYVASATDREDLFLSKSCPSLYYFKNL
jgi:hypothetical protein